MGETQENSHWAKYFYRVVNKILSAGVIHPSQPILLEHSEFITVKGNKLRIIHVKPENVKLPIKSTHLEAAEKRLSLSRNSLTEEYWFTRWNKPLRSNPCNCSFRKSGRFSRVSIKEVNEPKHVVIHNVETFVERLIQETVFEAFQEYFICSSKPKEKDKIEQIKNKQNKNLNKAGCGHENLAFTDEVDSVMLRNKITKPAPAVLEAECKASTVVNNNVKKTCNHKNFQKKPMIILLHGIGSGADIWWNVINSLLSKGYEVIAPDMLGHGFSSAPYRRRAYRFKNLLTHVIAVFDTYAAKDETRKFIIIGHSFGCSLASALSRYRPQQIVQLVLISGGGPTALSPPVETEETVLFRFYKTLMIPLLICGLKRSYIYSSRGKHFKSCDVDASIPKYVLDYIMRGQNWPEGDAAFHRRILIPTLLVHGMKDTEVTLVQECEMERTIPRACLELIPTAGHLSLLETPEQLSHMILCFVNWWAR